MSSPPCVIMFNMHRQSETPSYQAHSHCSLYRQHLILPATHAGGVSITHLILTGREAETERLSKLDKDHAAEDLNAGMPSFSRSRLSCLFHPITPRHRQSTGSSEREGINPHLRGSRVGMDGPQRLPVPCMPRGDSPAMLSLPRHLCLHRDLVHQGCEKDVEITDVEVFVSQQATKGYFSSETVHRRNQTQIGGGEFKTRKVGRKKRERDFD